MEVIQFVREGLGNSSYLVETGQGHAALIDPDRIVDRYLETAKSRGWKITAIFETHMHADFISGCLEAAHQTGAEIYLPEDSGATFGHQPLKPSQILEFSGSIIRAVGSPGHTPEHMSYVFNVKGEAPALFSGGSLIVGGAARTDLISEAMTEALTRAQYRTIHSAFSDLPGETVLYPTHGAGSFWALGTGDRRVSTLAEERATNHLLSYKSEDEFVSVFPTTFPTPPIYFFRTRPLNQAGPSLRRDVAMPRPLAPNDFQAASRESLIIDARPLGDYSQGHIDGALSNTFRGVYATWLGWLVEENTPLLFVTGDTPIDQVIADSMLVGHERFAGWLEGGMDAWAKAGLPVVCGQLLDAHQSHRSLMDGAVALDVRETREFQSGHLPEAVHIPLGSLEDNLGRLPKDIPILAYCGHGERSATGLSILERRGFDRLLNLNGGIGAWQDAGYRVE